MSLTDIKAKIEGDARVEAEEIISRFREQADEILESARVETEKLKKNFEEKIKTEETEILRRRKIVAHLDAGKLELGARRDLIKRSFFEALSILSRTPRERYVSFMTDLLERSVSSGDETIFVGKEEAALDENWIKSFNDSKNASLKLSAERVQTTGGFIARRGDIYINCTWEVLLQRVRDDLETEVVRRLFSD